LTDIAVNTENIKGHGEYFSKRVLSQYFCFPSRIFWFACKTFAFSHKTHKSSDKHFLF